MIHSYKGRSIEQRYADSFHVIPVKYPGDSVMFTNLTDAKTYIDMQTTESPKPTLSRYDALRIMKFYTRPSEWSTEMLHHMIRALQSVGIQVAETPHFIDFADVEKKVLASYAPPKFADGELVLYKGQVGEIVGTDFQFLSGGPTLITHRLRIGNHCSVAFATFIHTN